MIAVKRRKKTGLRRIVFLALAGLMPGAVPAHAQQGQDNAGASVDVRLSRIEERILDLQSVIGTLQSFVESGSGQGPGRAGPAPGGAYPGSGGPPPQGGDASGGSLAIRVQAMETQIQALTSQVERINDQLARITGQGGAPGSFRQGSQDPAQQGGLPGGLQGFQSQPQAQSGGSGRSQVPAFGTTVNREQDSGQQGGSPYGSSQPYGPSGPSQSGSPQDGGQRAPVPPMEQTDAARTASASSGQARAAYERSYSHLVRRDFASAEAGFRDFLQSHPEDPLASNAYYWLGETYYVRGDYKAAADTLLEGYKQYSDGVKAPDSLLKLGMGIPPSS